MIARQISRTAPNVLSLLEASELRKLREGEDRPPQTRCWPTIRLIPHPGMGSEPPVVGFRSRAALCPPQRPLSYGPGSGTGGVFVSRHASSQAGNVCLGLTQGGNILTGAAGRSPQEMGPRLAEVVVNDP